MYSLINIGGLAVGMAVAIFIGLWVHDELSFNKYHKNYEKIAQIRRLGTDPNTKASRSSEALFFPMGASIKKNYSHLFDKVLMAFWTGDYTLYNGNTKIPLTGEFIEDGAIDMFSLKMIQGTASAMKDPHSIILSASTATALFGDANPMEKTVSIDNRMPVVVRGVYEDLPKNTRFRQVDFFSTWALWVASNQWVKDCENSWDNSSFNTYVQLKPNVSIERASNEAKHYFKKYGPKELSSKYKAEVQLYPMSKWHLYATFENGQPTGGLITFVYLFSIIGLFVLLLACINFMNLSTARSEKRGKEVGIRKAIGSEKSQLVVQFLSESFLVVVLAFILSILLVLAGLGWFNELSDKEITLPFSNLNFWLIALGFIAFTGFLAGLYPAFYLSSFKPIAVLKGTLRMGRFAAMPRKVLVVVQFTVSVVLIIGTIVVYQQINHARNRPLGFNKNALLSIFMNDPAYQGKTEILERELVNSGAVNAVGYATSPIMQTWSNEGGFLWQGKDPEQESNFAFNNISYDYFTALGCKMRLGRNFSKSFSTDSSALIINETAAKFMNLKNPIGQIIRNENGTGTYQIVGVVEDIMNGSPYEPVKRAFYTLDAKAVNASHAHLRLNPNLSASQALTKIEGTLKKIVPSAVFDYHFLDNELEDKVVQEQRIGKLASIFAILAIFISCLGLFGLASFVAEQRTKEIGVRKVLGATVANLWQLLSKDFVVLVIISCLMAAPIAYYFMNEWLQKYTYRTEISWWIFAAAGMGALLITLLTVSYQAIKTALMNPVKSLKTE